MEYVTDWVHGRDNIVVLANNRYVFCEAIMLDLIFLTRANAMRRSELRLHTFEGGRHMESQKI